MAQHPNYPPMPLEWPESPPEPEESQIINEMGHRSVSAASSQPSESSLSDQYQKFETPAHYLEVSPENDISSAERELYHHLEMLRDMEPSVFDNVCVEISAHFEGTETNGKVDEEGRIAVRRGKGVLFRVKNASEEMEINLGVKNKKLESKDKRVISCPKHKKIEQEVNYPHEDMVFFISSSNNPVVEEGSGQSFVKIKVTTSLLQNGCVDINVFFKCLTSCEADFSKGWEFSVEVLESKSKNILKTKAFDVKVCQMPKRDQWNKQKRKLEEAFPEGDFVMVKFSKSENRKAVLHILGEMKEKTWIIKDPQLVAQVTGSPFEFSPPCNEGRNDAGSESM